MNLLPLAGLLLPLLAPGTSSPSIPPEPSGSQGDEAQAQLREALAPSGLLIDFERGVVSLPARVMVRDDFLEYLLVTPNGAAHESLFVTEVQPSLLNAALLALGVEPGKNATWITESEGADPDRTEGRVITDVTPPQGGGFFLYAGWREGDEEYFFRVDDLVSNLETRRSMRRHRWVFLGSRFAQVAPGEPERFVADALGNLVNLSFFFQPNTLVTGSLPECVRQTIWVANAWILPPRGSEVRFLFARERLETMPQAWRADLPVVGAEADSPNGD